MKALSGYVKTEILHIRLTHMHIYIYAHTKEDLHSKSSVIAMKL